MSETLITIIAIFTAAILMFVFPMMALSERNDDIAQLSVQTATSEFVDNVRASGVVSQDKYSDYIQTLQATGNSFDVELELKILDENLSSKVGQAASSKIGENVYYSVYTSQIEEVLNTKGKYILKEGDIISVTAKNTNTTISEMLRNFFYSISGNTSYQIAGQDSAMVAANGK